MSLVILIFDKLKLHGQSIFDFILEHLHELLNNIQ